jgi:hypothetical protein
MDRPRLQRVAQRVRLWFLRRYPPACRFPILAYRHYRAEAPPGLSPYTDPFLLRHKTLQSKHAIARGPQIAAFEQPHPVVGLPPQ